MAQVRVQQETFSLGSEVEVFSTAQHNAGAIVSFAGIVRDDSGVMSEMTIEHYPGMTEAALQKICDEAVSRWSLADALVIHRYGVLRPGEKIMMVATAARHRKDAFEAAEYLMDYLKSRAPFWKQERGANGESWVAAKDTDEDALTRW
ncbi:MAG: molybdopterin synthase catalytic subunit [Paracoccaceae bacterium]|jgi:molybdopterin synthase catalytic subunit